MNEQQYQQGIDQFAQMVGADKIDALRERFRSVSPEFEEAVMSIIGGQIWTRPNLDLRTRSLVSIATLAAPLKRRLSKPFSRSPSMPALPPPGTGWKRPNRFLKRIAKGSNEEQIFPEDLPCYPPRFPLTPKKFS
jgi:hypothetical protein